MVGGRKTLSDSLKGGRARFNPSLMGHFRIKWGRGDDEWGRFYFFRRAPREDESSNSGSSSSLAKRNGRPCLEASIFRNKEREEKLSEATGSGKKVEATGNIAFTVKTSQNPLIIHHGKLTQGLRGNEVSRKKKLIRRKSTKQSSGQDQNFLIGASQAKLSKSSSHSGKLCLSLVIVSNAQRLSFRMRATMLMIYEGSRWFRSFSNFHLQCAR